MPKHVGTTNPDGVDFGWVMQVTFVTTIVVGAPLVALLSTQVSLPDWNAIASFAIRVAAVVWIVTGISVYLYARKREADSSDERTLEDDD